MIGRPQFPKRCVITGGMPYGNKALHFGHIAGMFVHADFFARFMRDRIGKDNVVFVSGTDCYGSPAMEGFRKQKDQGFSGTIIDYVKSNHDKQVDTFNKYEISLDFFGASAFGDAKANHDHMSEYFLKKMDDAGAVSKQSTMQFFDQKLGVFLNGRQVVGKCPIEGCTSEKGYADECDMGHQYDPTELLFPVSALSGETPIFKESANLYFNLQDYTEILKKWINIFENDTTYRPYIVKEIKEFLKKPEVYVKKDYFETIEQIKEKLGKFELVEENKASNTLIFDTLAERERACKVLRENNIRFRTGKTLVPFRLTGNIEWGVKVPETKGLSGLTFYVWPESLWAPISFTKTYLEKTQKQSTWEDWWCDKNCQVYQFIGEDNIYFYGPAEMAIWLSLQGKSPTLDIPNGELQIPRIVANKHILFLNKKASSSGSVKPPMADDLLSFYTPEQLRAHFLGLGLGYNNVSFMPKPLNPLALPNEADPALREGNLLTNVFNRVARTVFYTLEQNFEMCVPDNNPDEQIVNDCREVILQYESLMNEQKFHVVMNVLDAFIRNINKYYVREIKEAGEDREKMKQVLANTIEMLRVATILVHPIAPSSTEKLAEYMNVKEGFFSWDNIFENIHFFAKDKPFKFKPIPPKFDFFEKHESQLIFD